MFDEGDLVVAANTLAKSRQETALPDEPIQQSMPKKVPLENVIVLGEEEEKEQLSIESEEKGIFDELDDSTTIKRPLTTSSSVILPQKQAPALPIYFSCSSSQNNNQYNIDAYRHQNVNPPGPFCGNPYAQAASQSSMFPVRPDTQSQNANNNGLLPSSLMQFNPFY